MTDGLQSSLSKFVAAARAATEDSYSKILKSDKESSNKVSFGDAAQVPSIVKLDLDNISKSINQNEVNYVA